MRWGLLAVLLGCVGCGGGGAQSSPDASDAAGCVSFANTVCNAGNLYAVDSCGNLEDRVEECLPGTVCIDSQDGCCFVAAASGSYAGGFSPMQITWGGEVPGQSLKYVGEVLAATTGPMEYGHSFTHRGVIGSTSYEFGLRTTVNNEAATRVGAGIFFTLLGEADIDLATPGENAWAGEGSIFGVDFTQITSTSGWSTGPFELELIHEPEGVAGRFGLYFTQAPAPRELIGHIEFPNSQFEVQTLLTQIYLKPAENVDFLFADTPLFAVRSRYEVDGELQSDGTVNYSNDLAGEPFTNADVTLESDNHVLLRQGGDVGRCGKSGPLR